MSAQTAVLSPEQVAGLLSVLTERKLLPPADLKRLRQLAEHLDSQWRLPLADALRLIFPDAPPAAAEANFRNLKSRLDGRQAAAIAAAKLHPEQRLALEVSAKRDDPAQRIGFHGRPPMQAWARVDDLEGAERNGPLYDNMAARPTGAQPILLLTVNQHERQAVLDVFLQGREPYPFLVDGFPYDYLGDAPGDAGYARPVVAFSCQMGSLRSGAALPRVADAIRHLRPYAVLAVGIAFGDKRKQALADVLIADQVQSYEPARLNPDGKHTWRSEKLPVESRWLERITQRPLQGVTQRKGLLLCGELLVDNAGFRKLLADEFPQAIGGDMESFGLAVACQHENVHWAVIKAVCDWGDGSINRDGDAKKTARQRRAALKAAQVAYSAVFLEAPPVARAARARKARAAGKQPAQANPPAAEPRTPDHDEAAKRKLLDLYGHTHSQRDGERAQDSAARSIHASLLAWLENPGAAPVFALLGEYGMGKTISCQRLYKALKAARQAPDAPAWMRRPVYFDLRELSLFKGRARGAETPLPTAEALVNDLFAFGWTAKPGQAKPVHADLQQWLAEGALLILDGLDECLVHLDEDQHGQFLQMLLRLLADHLPDDGETAPPLLPRLLVSCRTNFFKTLSDQRNTFTGYRRGRVDAQWYESRVLLPLTEAQVREYLAAVLPELPIAQIEALIDSTHNLREMAERPMTLKLLGEYIPDLEAERAAGGVVNGAYLYGRVANKWLQRDQGKHHLRPEHKLRLMPALAAYLWRSRVRSLPYDELHAWFHDWRDSQPDLARLYAPGVYNQSKLEEDLRTATFVVRQDADDASAKNGGDDADAADGFRFAHSSLAEYFLAVYLADAVRADRFEDWAMPIPSVETLGFLAQKLTLDQAALPAARRRDGGLIATLNRWRKSYLAQATELLLRHALGALRLPEGERVAPMLAGFDLRGAQLRDWRFGERFADRDAPLLDMVGVQWTDADLRDCDFAHVRLDDGDFSGARLDLAAFQHCSAQRCDWRNSDLLGTVFRHCRIDGSQWQPLRQCHRPNVVDCSGAETLTDAIRPAHEPVGGPSGPNHILTTAISTATLATLPPKLRASIASQGDTVRSVALSADGDRVVSGSDDGTVRVWEAASGECVRELRGHTGWVRSVALSADGGRVVSGSDDGTVRVWEAASGKCVRELRGLTRAVNSVALSADGGRVVSGGTDGTVRVWDAANSECVRELRGHESQVDSVALSGDGGRIVSCSYDGTVRVWESSSGECVRELRGHAGWVRSVALSADGGRVVSCGDDGTVRVWESSSGECVRELRGHAGRVLSVVLSADGGRVVSGGDDGTVRVWESSSGECVRELREFTTPVWSVALSADGGRVVSGSHDGAVRVWEVTSGECVRELRGHTSRVLSVALSADGGRVVSGSDDGTVWVWDATSGETLRELRGHTRGVSSVSLSADGGRAVSGSYDGTLRVWDATSGECVRELRGHTRGVTSVSLSADGGRVVSGSDGTMGVWDATSGECVRELRGLRGHTSWVRSVALSADGGVVVSGSDDNTVRVWDATSGECVRELRGHTRWVRSVALSTDGGRVVSGSSDGTVRVWDASSDECVRELRGHESGVLGVALSADGGRVVSGSSDGTVRVWDATSGECVRELRGHTDWVRSVALSADGGRVVSGSSDGTVRCFAGADGRAAANAADLHCAWVAAVGSPHDILSHASWRPAQDGEGDTLISASGDAWRFLSWDVADPTEPSGWRRVPLQAYE